MSDAAPKPYPIPASILHIQGDPTAWGLKSLPPSNPEWGTDPIALDLIGPLTGTMLLSPTKVGSLALLPPPPGDGWVPASRAVRPYIYLPSAKGEPSASPGYWLAGSDTDLADLQQRILEAMRTGQTITVSIDAIGPGVVVLNGSELPFVVIGDVQGNL